MNPPEPIIVKDCRPATLPSSSDQNMQNFLNFGGGVNPMAYKGYTFSKQGRFQFRQSTSTAVSPTVQLHSTHNTKSSQTPKLPKEAPAPPPPERHCTTSPEHGSHLCCPLIGPVTPLFANASVYQIATSSILSHNIYLSWRILLLSFSVLAIVLTIVENLAFIATLPGLALVYSFFSASVMVTAVTQYRLAQIDDKHLTEPNQSHGCVAVIFQGSSHACFITGIASYLLVLYGAPGIAFLAASFFQSSSVYLLLIMAMLQLIDICFTPLPFRLLNTVPLYALILLFFIISLWGSTTEQVVVASAIMVGSSLCTAFLIHLFARGILLAVHNNAMGVTGSAREGAIDPWADII